MLGVDVMAHGDAVSIALLHQHPYPADALAVAWHVRFRPELIVGRLLAEQVVLNVAAELRELQ